MFDLIAEEHEVFLRIIELVPSFAGKQFHGHSENTKAKDVIQMLKHWSSKTGKVQKRFFNSFGSPFSFEIKFR